MDFHGIHDRLKAIDVPGLLAADLPRPADKETKDPGRTGDPFVLVDPHQIVHFLGLCREDDALSFEILADLSATDPAVDATELWVNINLLSIKRRHRLAIKSILPKDALTMPSSVPIYRAAQWHERECAEMFGITFAGNPDPRHILLPDDWVGYPMRKDYEFPKEYNGISCE